MCTRIEPRFPGFEEILKAISSIKQEIEHMEEKIENCKKLPSKEQKKSPHFIKESVAFPHRTLSIKSKDPSSATDGFQKLKNIIDKQKTLKTFVNDEVLPFPVRKVCVVKSLPIYKGFSAPPKKISPNIRWRKQKNTHAIEEKVIFPKIKSYDVDKVRDYMKKKKEERRKRHQEEYKKQMLEAQHRKKSLEKLFEYQKQNKKTLNKKTDLVNKIHENLHIKSVTTKEHLSNDSAAQKTIPVEKRQVSSLNDDASKRNHQELIPVSATPVSKQTKIVKDSSQYNAASRAVVKEMESLKFLLQERKSKEAETLKDLDKCINKMTKPLHTRKWVEDNPLSPSSIVKKSFINKTNLEQKQLIEFPVKDTDYTFGNSKESSFRKEISGIGDVSHLYAQLLGRKSVPKPVEIFESSQEDNYIPHHSKDESDGRSGNNSSVHSQVILNGGPPTTKNSERKLDDVCYRDLSSTPLLVSDDDIKTMIASLSKREHQRRKKLESLIHWQMKLDIEEMALKELEKMI